MKESNQRWCSDGFEFRCNNSEKLRVTFALYCCDREFAGESSTRAARLIIDHGRLLGMDVNDNLRGWDDDLVVNTVHMT